MNKQELIAKIREELVWYAIPRNIQSRPKEWLEKHYEEAKKLKLVKGEQEKKLAKLKEVVKDE